MDTVGELIRSRDSRVAIQAPGRAPLTHARLAEHIQKTGDRLRSLGIGRGDRVVSVLPSGPDAASAIPAIASHATVVPLDPVATPHEYETLFRILEPKIILSASGVTHAAAEAACAAGIPVIEVHSEDEAGVFTLVGRTGFLSSPPSAVTPDDYAYILSTSGTTGFPKLVPVPHRGACSAAASIAAALDLGESDACLVFTPLHHSLGVVSGVLVPLSSGGRSIILSGFEIRQFFESLTAYRPTWFPTVPAHLQTILEHAPRYNEAIEAAPLRFIRPAGAPLAPFLQEQVEKTLRVPVLQVYGLSEAPAIASHDMNGSSRKPGSVGRLMRNAVAILDEDDRPLPPGAAGEIAVRGPSVISCYFRNETATRNAIRNGWFHTGDVGFLDGDGYLFLTGRRSEFINRGGEKIMPVEIDQVLLAHHSVADALTFPIAANGLGEEVGAAIVLRPGAHVSASDLQAFAATRLSVHKIPRRIFFVDAIPTGSTGKAKRLNMAEQLAVLGAEGSGRPIGGAVDRHEETLAGLFAKALGVAHVRRDDNFFDLGGESLTAARCAAEIRRDFGLPEFSPAVFLWAPTVARMAKVLSEAHGGDAAIVVPIQPEGDGIPLFLLDPNMEARAFVRHLGRRRAVFGVRLPNLAERGAPVAFEEIAEECLNALRHHRPNGPYALAGWCGAGLLAREVALQLDRQGAEVAFVALFDARNIFLPPLGRGQQALVRATHQAQRVWFFLSRMKSSGFRLTKTTLHDRVTRRNPNAEAFNDALHRYHLRPWNGRMIHVWASNRPRGPFREVDFGWRHLAPRGFVYYEVPGDHMSMLSSPELAEILAEEMAGTVGK